MILSSITYYRIEKQKNSIIHKYNNTKITQSFDACKYIVIMQIPLTRYLVIDYQFFLN